MTTYFVPDEAGIQHWESDWTGDCGDILNAAGDMVLSTAKAKAPVNKGRPTKVPNGWLKSVTRKANETYDDSGRCLMLIGFGKAGIYPGAFSSQNQFGSTKNANQFGTYGRREIDFFLSDSLGVLSGFNWRDGLW